jgi:hypothetical protein
MDYFAHAAWSFIFFNKKKPIWAAIAFGILPDTLSWFLFMVYNLLFNGADLGKPALFKLPSWMISLYGVTHSLIVFLVIAGIIYLIFKKIPWYVYAWPIHILMDIPTHSRDFLPTPFLWPISNWFFPGFSWGQPWFMVLNWSLILIFIAYVIGKRLRTKSLGKKKQTILG